MPELTPPHHGGDLQRAIAEFGGTPDDWIDCSTGIAPIGFPLPAVPASVWQRLPEPDPALLDAAAQYYGSPQLLAVPGSQAAIERLPTLRRPGRVGVLAASYAEHAWQWRRHGHAVVELAAEDIDAAIDRLQVLVLVNPNNPTGQRWPADRLLAWHARLAARGGWLVVDEAFADCEPAHSLLPHVERPGLIVLRSLGKFFGLAGVRLGFVAAEAAMRDSLQQALGPWAVSGPAQWAGRLALADTAWQAAQRERLADDSRWLAATLPHAGLTVAAALPLLHWVPTPRAAVWQRALAQQQVWCRRFDRPSALRFGPLPASRRDEFTRRLDAALGAIAMALPK